jgi:hypothetical protein
MMNVTQRVQDKFICRSHIVSPTSIHSEQKRGTEKKRSEGLWRVTTKIAIQGEASNAPDKLDHPYSRYVVVLHLCSPDFLQFLPVLFFHYICRFISHKTSSGRIHEACGQGKVNNASQENAISREREDKTERLYKKANRNSGPRTLRLTFRGFRLGLLEACRPANPLGHRSFHREPGCRGLG